MITASELREITATSQKQIDFTLAQIEKELIKEAEAGNRMYACYREVKWSCERTYTTPPVTKFQQKLVDELKKLGYNAKVEAHGDPYVPRSMDEEDGPLHQNHVLVIRW